MLKSDPKHMPHPVGSLDFRNRFESKPKLSATILMECFFGLFSNRSK